MTRATMRALRLGALALLLAATACNDQVAPTTVDPDAPGVDAPRPPQDAPRGNAILSDRAHALPRESFELLSTPAELTSGRYRFRPVEGVETPEVTRDDFIVTTDADGAMIVRRVLESAVQNGELVMETGPAYWPDVLRSGTYSLTMPLDGRGNAQFLASGPQAVSLSVAGDSLDLPPLEFTFADTDVCLWIHEVLLLIPGSHPTEVCGKPVDMEVAYGVSLAASGTLDSLRILNGHVRVEGQLDVSLTVDAGSVSGGQAPTFYPCNLAAYTGCVSTPTGAALIDFLRRYAPSIPDASLPPIRVCIPGTPVRTRSGYWSGWTWHPAVWVQCRISDAGQLPSIVLPSIQAAANELRPRIVGDMTVRVKGDGAFTIEVPIPDLAAKAAYAVTNDFKAKAEVGVFILLRATLKNTAATVKLVFDDTGRLTETWTDAAGWGADFGVIHRSNHAELLALDNPDSVVVRVGVPVKVNAEACIAIWACGKTDEEGGDPDNQFELQIFGKQLFGGTGFNVGAKAGLGVSMFQESTFTREQVDPDSAEIDNIHVSLDGAYDAFAQAGLHIPLTGWILPSVPRDFEREWECCRVPVADYWGQGRLEVTTFTSGADIDPDGYKVVVERADTLPTVMDAGIQRIGPGWPHRAFEESVDPNGTVSFGDVAGFLPCIAVYSDAFITSNPVWGLSVAAARSQGVNIPTYGATSACHWLVARYRVTLSDVASNCVVTDGAVRDSVWLQSSRVSPVRDNLRQIQFDVECGVAGAQGGLEVVLNPIGRDPGSPPALLVDGQTAAVFERDTVQLSELAPGSYDVELQGLQSLCTSSPETVTVVGGTVTSVTPQVVCAAYDPPPGSVTYRASMTGSDPDQNGYSLVRDGQPGAYLPPDGSGEVRGLSALEPTVLMVTDIAGNCQAEDLNPRLVTPDASNTRIDVPFPVTCVAAKPDTLVGTLDANGWPSPTVTLRATDGTTLVVNGPKTGELARLTGSPVRVWGQASATGINVHGYDLRSKLGDDRWLGIVLDRPDGTWLFGDEAILLVDPPASLIAESGNLVWVTGREEAEGVRPTLYGVIRAGG